MDIETLIILAIYVIGVYLAYFNLIKWCKNKPKEEEEYNILFTLSLISWLIFPIYLIIWAINKAGED